MRRSLLYPSSMVAVFLSGCAPLPAERLPDLSGYNLVVITVDTLRADRLGVYGDERAATPNIDALARSGARFAEVYAPVPLTLPAHASLFTALRPLRHGVRTNGSYFLRSDDTTLAELLRQHGYHTAAFVSTYVLSGRFGLEQGFDSYDDRLADGDLVRGFDSDIAADEVVTRAGRWLAGARPPFFLWIHFYDPHQPYAPPPPFAERFADDPYRGEVAFVDQQIGELLAALEDHPRTLITLLSDHGEGFGEHGEVGHGLLAYDEQLRVPWILAAGDPLRRQRPISTRARMIDVAPTLLDLLAIPVPEGIDGRSLAPALVGDDGGSEDPPRGDETVYFESLLGQEENGWAAIRGVIEGELKYIEAPRPELYHLGDDPGERHNLFESQPAAAAALAEVLAELGETDDREGARRSVTAEDIAHLRALGYIAEEGRLGAGGSAAAGDELIDPKDGIVIERRLQTIRSLVAGGEIEAAADALKRLEREQGAVPVGSFFFLLHQVHAARGDEDAAIGALERGLARYPGSQQFYLLLAHYALDIGRPAVALGAVDAALDVDPRFSQAMVVRGSALEALGRFAEAAGAYREAAALEPRNHALQYRLAEASVQSGDLAAGLAAFDRLIAADAFAEVPDIFSKAAIIASRLGVPERAEELFRRGLESHPRGVDHLAFGLFLAQQGRTAEAREQLRGALADQELDPGQRILAERMLAQWSAR